MLVTSFSNIFSNSMGCLFVLSVVSCPVQKLLSLIRSQKRVVILSCEVLGWFCYPVKAN